MPDVFDELNGYCYAQRVHKAPVACEEAMLIWRECKLGDVEPEPMIALTLEIWAEGRNLIYSRGGVKYVGWDSPMGARYDMKLTTLNRWMICACNPDMG